MTKRSCYFCTVPYAKISGRKWGEARRYDLCLDSSVGVEKAAAVITAYVKEA
jgi:hypothetical protein